MKKKWWLALTCFIVTIGLIGCQSTNKEKETAISEQHPMHITTTFFPMYDFTKQIVGKYGDVSMIVPSNTEPHDFEPSAKDMAKISDSQLFVYNSNDMEHWVKAAKKSADKQVTFVEAAKTITPMTYGKDTDPHTWLDPILAKKEVQTISQAIIEKDPSHKSYYQSRTDALIKQLDALNDDFQQMVDQAKHKTFITQHAAFGYLAHQYGLTQTSIVGLNDEQEPSPKQLAQTQAYMKKHHLSIIYTETGISNKLAKTLQETTGATLLTLNPLESVSKEAIEKGATYISLMKENLKQLQKGLNQ